jgi:CheY-like chemotaxis protein
MADFASFSRPILLVEDNPMDVDLTLRAFKEHGIANPIVVCRDGEEALHYMEEHRSVTDPGVPILVLLDLRLPRIDGIELLRWARNSETAWKHVLFVVLTTSREGADVQSAYEFGVNSYVVKPVDFRAFVELARTIKVYWLLTNEPPFQDTTAR